MGGGGVYSMVVSSYVSLFRAKGNYHSEVEYILASYRGRSAGHIRDLTAWPSKCRPVEGLTPGQVSEGCDQNCPQQHISNFSVLT